MNVVELTRKSVVYIDTREMWERKLMIFALEALASVERKLN